MRSDRLLVLLALGIVACGFASAPARATDGSSKTAPNQTSSASAASPAPVAGGDQTLYPIEVGKLWGYMNRAGELKIAPRFSWARPFASGVASVSGPDHKDGLIDQAGNYLFQPKYELILPPQEGLVLYVDGGNPKVFNVGHYGFMDLKGQVVIEPKLALAWDFCEGLAAAAILAGEHGPAKVGFIDKTGAWVVKPTYEMTGIPGMKSGFSEGLARVGTTTGLGYIDKKGRMVIEPRFAFATDFKDGLAAVKLTPLGNGKNDAGLIDKENHLVFEPKFAAVGSFAEGLAPAAATYDQDLQKPVWGYVDRTGKWAIEPRFYYAEPMAGGWGRVAVKPAERPGDPDQAWYGLVNSKGRVLQSDQYSYTGSFSDGLAPVRVKNGVDFQMGYVDSEGRLVWDPRRVAPNPKSADKPEGTGDAVAAMGGDAATLLALVVDKAAKVQDFVASAKFEPFLDPTAPLVYSGQAKALRGRYTEISGDRLVADRIESQPLDRYRFSRTGNVIYREQVLGPSVFVFKTDLDAALRLSEKTGEGGKVDLALWHDLLQPLEAFKAEGFDLKWDGTENGQAVVNGTMKKTNPNGTVDDYGVVIKVSLSDGLLRSMVVKSNNRLIFRIELSDIRTNQGLRPVDFDYTVPANAKVIDTVSMAAAAVAAGKNKAEQGK